MSNETMGPVPRRPKSTVRPGPAMDKAKADSRTLREQGRGEIASDVLGSYTGTPEDGGRPVQDADDL